jgi:hypothetical protein
MQKYQDARYVTDCIKQILRVIPQTETKLINEIKTYYDSLWNQAPDVLQTSYCWTPLQTILNNNISYFDEEWKCEVLNIFSCKNIH